jgi:glycosyltransferase involved in cell wall biosynthesis
MVTFSAYPADPRPRRAIDALLGEGATVDLVCLDEGKEPRRESIGGLNVLRLPIKHHRGGKVSYAYQYSAFISAAASVFALRAFKRRYDLVHVHNMPDVLVFSALVPKLLGAKVLLDLHDPMPELMTTIFNLDRKSLSVQIIERLEKLSIGFADKVVTVNIACKRIFSTRSCAADKIGVVMNAPDGKIFPFRQARPTRTATDATTRPFVIMYHGSLVERNGLDLAVEALAQLGSAVPTAELRIFGRKTPFLEQVMETVRGKGLEGRVHYLGPRSLEQLVQEIEACDVGVIPNQRNAFTDINTPTRMFEYLALGKPVIAPSTPGIQDYFNTESLFFFESGNAAELASQMRYVFLHPNEALQTAVRGQEVFQAHTWDQERETLLDLVTGMLSGRRKN